MAVAMRLRREGSNQRPYYRLVVIDSRTRRQGRYLEKVGEYAPMQEKDKVRVDGDRVKFWLGKGAMPSDRVRQLLKGQGILVSR